MMSLSEKINSPGTSRGLERAAVGVMLLLFVLRAMDSADKKSLTYDEVVHIPAGYLYALKGNYLLNPEHPPLCKILGGAALLPMRPSLPEIPTGRPEIEQWRFGEEFFSRNSDTIDRMVFSARLPMILLGAVLGLAVYLWARDMYGGAAGLASLFFYTFCPNFLAHSPLVNTDVGGAVFIFLCVFMVYRFLSGGRDRHIYWAGVFLGLALASKFTAPVMLAPSLALALAHQAAVDRGRVKPEGWRLKIFFAVALSVVVLAASYRFAHLGSYFRGFREVLQQTGGTGWTNYLNGSFSENGFRSYYVYAFMLKTPLPYILFIFAALACGFKGGFKKEEAFLLYPVLVLFVLASLSRKQIGLRYILPLYPFLYVFAGRLFRVRLSGPGVKKAYKTACAGVLLLWCLFTSSRYHPSYIAYFNEIAGGPGGGPAHLLDSNIDWGQDLKGLRSYLEGEGNPELILSYSGSIDPAVYGIEYQPLFPVGSYTAAVNSFPPEKEYLAVNVNQLWGLDLNESFFKWLRPMVPEAKIGYSIYVYDITGNLYARRNLYGAFAFMGFREAAERELEIIAMLEGG